MRPSARTRDALARHVPRLLVALLPGGLTVYLAFDAGGFYLGTQATVAAVLIAIIAVRALAAPRPGEGLGRLAALAAVALTLFAAWTLLSGTWSHAPARALVTFELPLLYLAALVLFGSLRADAERLRWMVRGMALAAVVVAGAGLTTRLLPDVWPLVYPSLSARLSYPVSYWNALGLLAALGVILCFGLTSDQREPRLVRVLAAGSVPILSAALLLTLSRGSIAAGILGIAVFAIVGHPRSLLAGVLATAPATTIAVLTTYHADLLVSDDPLTRAARDQGEHVALTVGLCVLGAVVVRALLLPADTAVARLRLGRGTRRLILAAGTVAILAAIASAAVAVDVSRQYDRFVAGGGAATAPEDPFGRLSDPANGGRIRQWRVALAEFREQPLRGRGAGTYELSWQERRDTVTNVRDAHSLYVEVMGELGLVGLVLLVTALLAILLGVAWRARGPDRAHYAAIVAAGVAWAAAAGIEWHWEMPVVTLWFFALGGAAIASRRDRASARELRPAARVALAVALCGLIVAVPVRLGVSHERFQAAYVALAQDDCPRVEDDATTSARAVGSRPEPYELRAACRLRAGQLDEAMRLLGQAIRRDPDNWRPRYSLALIQGRASQDPRPAARAALRRDPHNSLTQDAVAAFERGSSPREWQAIARTMRTAVPPF